MGFYCYDCGKDVDDKQPDQTMSRTHDTIISSFDLDRLEAELAAVTEQRDRLAEAATVLIAAKGRHNTMLAYQGLNEALAAVKGGES
jgi:hypothetical protein